MKLLEDNATSMPHESISLEKHRKYVSAVYAIAMHYAVYVVQSNLQHKPKRMGNYFDGGSKRFKGFFITQLIFVL